MKKIPIVLATDKNLIAQMYITMLSAIKNKKKETAYDFFCLIQNKLTKRQEKYFNKLKKYPNITINFINMKEEFDFITTSILHITTPTYYRLKIAELLPQYDKALYLDTDICVLDDLTELYKTDLENNYAAGVQPTQIRLQERLEDFKNIGIDNTNSYINAGVILFNLELIRNDNKTPELLEASKQMLKLQDQDVINLIFFNRIKILDFKYNVVTIYLKSLENDPQLAERSYGLENYKNAIKNPTIVHYLGEDKPWNTVNVPLAHHWLKYARKCPFKWRGINSLHKKLDAQLKANSNKRIAFWGASLFLNDFINSNIKLKRIAGIIDKDETKWGKKIGKYTIYSPNEIDKLRPDVVAFSIKHNSEKIYPKVNEFLNENYPHIQLLPNIFNTENC